MLDDGHTLSISFILYIIIAVKIKHIHVKEIIILSFPCVAVHVVT